MEEKLVKDMTVEELKALIAQVIREDREIQLKQAFTPRPEDTYKELWNVDPMQVKPF